MPNLEELFEEQPKSIPLDLNNKPMVIQQLEMDLNISLTEKEKMIASYLIALYNKDFIKKDNAIIKDFLCEIKTDMSSNVVKSITDFSNKKSAKVTFNIIGIKKYSYNSFYIYSIIVEAPSQIIFNEIKTYSINLSDL